MDKRIAHILHRGSAQDFRNMAEEVRHVPGGYGHISEALDSVAFALEPDHEGKHWVDGAKSTNGDPYTVVVRLLSEPHFRYIQVNATSLNEVRLVAIDATIEADGIVAAEDDGKDLDHFRADYECVAIYAGHHTNLI